LGVDAITQAWIRNASDVKAAEAGCIFDLERAESVCDWIEAHCNLYEGTNQPMVLADWQREATLRMFGWVRWSPRLQRWIRRFTRASVWIPKKNGKTPTAAAWALYLLIGDGEPGQKVFFAAADGQQARLAAKHAIEMRNASPELMEETALNLTEMKVVHLPTLSEAKPISSGDNRAAKAKQGLNGSVVIDEVHVVSAEFISESSIDRAGASRDEPLHIEVSTAGKDSDGYGRRQYDYGRMVELGDVDDQAFFFLAYEAPQDLKDEDLDADPLRWGKLANPTWGRIIQEDEYLADYRRSKRSLSDLADFKTFRLNIWQQSASPWLRMEDWRACRAAFGEDDLLGRSCSAGLDLSKTRDMTALVLAFYWEGKYRLLPYFFLPAAGVDRLAIRLPQILDWVQRGHVIKTDGDVLDYGFVRAKIEALAAQFCITQLIFDKSFGAEFVTQEIAGKAGIECLEFNQGILAYTQPTNDFERLVIAGELQHNDHPVMNWQVGHVAVKTDANYNKKPVKPKHDDPRKIDGVVAAIMALAGAIREHGAGGWWTPGMMKD
jgi:phage terminase large subunit-like protein